ncbi:MAG: lamin tail domain-containing protein [Verrucomicrobiota bacterium]
MDRYLLFCFAFALGTTSARADVVINEFSAVQTERLLRWNDDEQPYTGPGHPWWSTAFDDSQWLTGATPIGFNRGTIFDVPITTNLVGVLKGISPSVYTRHVFSAPAGVAESGTDVILSINGTDGYIIWLNGKERSRRNMGAEKAHIYFDQLAYVEGSDNRNLTDLVLGEASDCLVAGENTLAIQVANFDVSSPMRLDMSLSVGDTALVPIGSTVSYLPGLLEPNADLFEPAALENGSSDWIELHNDSESAVDIAGWSLTDDKDEPAKWPFPAGTSIPADGYLIVLADNPTKPIAEASYLHANFKLSSNGEYVGLFDRDGTLQHEVAPAEQHPFHSYGTVPDGTGMTYFALPSPGKPNTGPALGGQVNPPDFDQEGGFYDADLTLTLTSRTVGASIRYTTDGSEPTTATGVAYVTPIPLPMVSDKRGHVIRARAFLDGMIPSETKTHTYLIGQDARVRTAPVLIFTADLPRSFSNPYGTLAIHGGRHTGDNWIPTEDGAYNNVFNRGRAYERLIHAEFYFADGTAGFRSECGIRVAASNHARARLRLDRLDESPWPVVSQGLQKPSFNLHFRNEYGNPDVTFPFHGPNASINTFKQFRIRAGKNDGINPFIIDELMRRLSKAMGQPASTGTINTLYLNGELKGIYNMTERLREPFLRANHGADPDSEWDILQFEGDVFTVDTIGNPRNNISSGDKVAWEELLVRLEAEETVANWQSALEYVDPVNIADYFLFNIYTAMWDWPHNNWVLARERAERGRFRAYVWDAEGGIGRSSARNTPTNIIDSFILGTREGSLAESGTAGELRDLWRGLTRWKEFRTLFADRIQNHLFNGGALDDRDFENSTLKRLSDEVVAEYDDLLDFVFGQKAIATHARNWATNSGGQPRRNYLFGPAREAFRNHDLWPTVTPPEFKQFGGNVAQGFSLEITSETGDLHYTLNGMDPRLPGGEPNPSATVQSGGTHEVALTDAVTVMARSYDQGVWSAVTRADFTVDTVPPSTENLAISELLYNPVGPTSAETTAGHDDGNDFEYLKLPNIGTRTVDLDGLRFVDGITFDFSTAILRTLAPGGEALIVADRDAFRLRFGSGHDSILAGEYRGRLNNGGEQLRLIDASENTLHEFTYQTEEPWPDLEALDGHSILLVEPSSNPAVGSKWRPSEGIGGTLGGSGPEILTFAQWQETNFEDPDQSAAAADPDKDGLNNLTEFALGTFPLSPGKRSPFPAVGIQTVDGDEFLVLEFRRQLGERGVEFSIQISSDLVHWSDTPAVSGSVTHADGTITTTLRETAAIGKTRYARLKLSVQP